MGVKKTIKRLLMICIYVAGSHGIAHAQLLKKITKKLEDKVEKGIDKALNGEESSNEMGSGSTETIREVDRINIQYNVDGIIFRDDFQNTAVGDMPVFWKTQSSGSIVKLENKAGKWLKLHANSTYKIDSLIDYPENFAIQFELITSSQKSGDIGAMGFGLAKDNAVSRYMMDAYNDNAICYSQLHFHNKEISTGSSDTNVSSYVDFPLERYSNTTMKVQYEVRGKNVRLIVDGVKVLDSKLLENKKTINFFLSAPFDYKNNAQVYFGKFEVFEL